MLDDVSGKKFIDREVDQENFRELLQFRDEARLLVVSDKGGRGKSTLLKKLKYICEWENDPEIPVSLIPLDQFPDNDPFILLTAVRNDLKSIQFGRFDELNNARTFHDLSKFTGSLATIRGTADFREAHIGGYRPVAGGTVQYIEYAEQVSSRVDWTPEMEEFARHECIKAFFDDLKQISKKQPVVVLLDSVDERSNADLREWIFRELIRRYCLDRETRPARFILVLAGRDLPDFKNLLGEMKFNMLVKSAGSLNWEEDHVRDFLQLNGYAEMSAEDIQAVYRKIREGWPLTKALELAALLQSG